MKHLKSFDENPKYIKLANLIGDIMLEFEDNGDIESYRLLEPPNEVIMAASSSYTYNTYYKNKVRSIDLCVEYPEDISISHRNKTQFAIRDKLKQYFQGAGIFLLLFF